ncbi:MAG: MarR family winged helix-turn-helix transcriptional regulator [Granulosicoccus sp.]
MLYLLAAASDKASAQFHVKVRERGLRVPEWRVLAILVGRDGAMITRLADFALIEQSRLTRIIDQMDMRGLVRRKSDANDRRRVRVFLTAKGRRLALSLVADAKLHEQNLLASLGGVNAEQLKPLLTLLLQKLEAEDE